MRASLHRFSLTVWYRANPAIAEKAAPRAAETLQNVVGSMVK